MENTYCQSQPSAGSSDTEYRAPYAPYNGNGKTRRTAAAAGSMLPQTTGAPMGGMGGMTQRTSDEPLPETLTNSTFVPGFLRTQIGKYVRVEFLIGNQSTDRVGTLLDVGASYILIQDLSGAATTMCDLFSIRFVTIIDSNFSGAVIMP